MSRSLALTFTIALVAGAIMGLAVVLSQSAQSVRGGILGSSGQALIGGPFELVDHTGRTVTEQDFRGKYMLLYFGFTHCPDICPSTLQVVATAMDALGDASDEVVPIMVTVDPARDTRELMAGYVTAFHPRLVGLTGSEEQVAQALKAYRIYAQKVPDPDDTNGDTYTMDHSSFLYLMDRQGRFVTHFTHGTRAETLAKRLAEHIG